MTTLVELPPGNYILVCACGIKLRGEEIVKWHLPACPDFLATLKTENDDSQNDEDAETLEEQTFEGGVSEDVTEEIICEADTTTESQQDESINEVIIKGEPYTIEVDWENSEETYTVISEEELQAGEIIAVGGEVSDGTNLKPDRKVFINKDGVRMTVILKSKPKETMEGEVPKYYRVCPFCKQQVSKRSFKGHIEKNHPEEDYEEEKQKGIYPKRDKKHVCDVCGASFNNTTVLRYHYNKHLNQTPYKCEYCGRGFINPSYLKLHINSCTGQRPFPCDECEKKFTRPAQLFRHKLVHKGEKRHECSECGKRFSTSTIRNDHYKCVHLKLPPRPRKNPRPKPTKQSIEIDDETIEMEEVEEVEEVIIPELTGN